MTPQPTSSGFWTIYMDNLDMTPVMSSPAPSDVSSNQPQQQQQQQQPNGGQQQQLQPEVQLIRLTKANSGMGLSIVAAKGVGKDKLGIYIKAVVEGGAAFHDGRLMAGDQLLKVDGKSLVGITQERAADIMMHTGQVVELEVAKQVSWGINVASLVILVI